jgi:hypothetical protein
MSDERMVEMMVEELNAKRIPGIPTMVPMGAQGALTVGGCIAGLRFVSRSEISAWWLQSIQTDLALLDAREWPLDADGYQAAIV